MGQLAEQELDDERRAFVSYGRAVRAQPDATESLEPVQRLAERLSTWRALAEILEEIFGEPALHTQALPHLRLLARLYAERLHRPERALEVLTRCVEILPDDFETKHTRYRVAKVVDDPVLLEEAAREVVNEVTDPEARVAVWHDILTASGKNGNAIGEREACEEILRVDPHHAVAGARLGQLYEDEGSYEALERLYVAQADGAADGGDKATVMSRLAQLRERQLDDEEGALRAYEAAWRLDPRGDEVPDRLEAHYRARQAWHKLHSLLGVRLEHAETQDARLRIGGEMARVAEEELGDVIGAISCYEELLSHAPGELSVLGHLIRLFEKRGDQARLAEAWISRASAQPRGDKQAADLIEAATIYRGELGEPDRAATLMQQALTIDANHPGAHALKARFQADKGDRVGAMAALDVALGRTMGAERCDLLIAYGELAHAEGAVEDAARVLLEASELCPDRPDVQRLVRDVLEETGRWDRLVEILQAEFQAASEDREASQRAVAIARVYQTHLNDDDAFLRWMAEAENARRDNPEVAELLADFHAAREEWPEASARLEWLVSYLEGKKLTEQLPRRAHQLAKMLEELGEELKALEYYKMALQADGMYVPNLVDFGRLLIKRESWHRALRVHQNLLMQRRKLASSEEREDVLYHLALACHELGEAGKARQYLNRLLRENPQHLRAKKLKNKVR